MPAPPKTSSFLAVFWCSPASRARPAVPLPAPKPQLPAPLEATEAGVAQAAQQAKQGGVHRANQTRGETLLDWLDGPRAGRNLCVSAPDWVIDEALKRAADTITGRDGRASTDFAACAAF